MFVLNRVQESKHESLPTWSPGNIEELSVEGELELLEIFFRLLSPMPGIVQGWRTAINWTGVSALSCCD